MCRPRSTNRRPASHARRSRRVADAGLAGEVAGCDAFSYADRDCALAATDAAYADMARGLLGPDARKYAGKSWGEQGAKRVVRDIVDSLDRTTAILVVPLALLVAGS